MTDSTYAKKFTMLKDLMPEIIETIRKDLKQDHLKSDPRFLKKYLDNKPINKLTNEDLHAGYTKALLEGEESELLGEFILNRWLMQNGDVYHYFEDYLSKISADFTTIETLSKEQAQPLLEGSAKEFGSENTFIFCILNSVVIPQDLLQEFGKRAIKERGSRKQAQQVAEEQRSWEQKLEAAELELQRVSDRYEKKLCGLQKKYTQDVGALKQQLANLQRKLALAGS